MIFFVSDQSFLLVLMYGLIQSAFSTLSPTKSEPSRTLWKSTSSVCVPVSVNNLLGILSGPMRFTSTGFCGGFLPLRYFQPPDRVFSMSSIWPHGCDVKFCQGGTCYNILPTLIFFSVEQFVRPVSQYFKFLTPSANNFLGDLSYQKTVGLTRVYYNFIQLD